MSNELLKGSERRLWDLVAERARPGADVGEVDRRIWDLFGETWTVMFTDLSGFSRQVEEFGILHFLQIQEVNAASKLGEDTAKSGEVLLTKAAVLAAGPIDGVEFARIDAQVGGSAENYRVVML